MPNSAEDIVLIVGANVFSDKLEDSILDWKVSITDENGRETVPGLATTGIINGVNQVKWVVIVARASQSFTLHLPGEQTVNLDSLLEK
jgi:hypothetical protein